MVPIQSSAVRGADNMQGGDGTDWLSYAGGTEGISVSLAETSGSGGDAAGDVYAGFENLIGSEGDDFLGGTAGANTIDGGAGDDTIAGGAGADAMNGGDGGGDWLDYSESSAGVTVDLAGGTGAGGDAEGDIFIDVENVLGSAADDSLIGGEGDNVIDGGAGNDTIVGSPGEDTLLGGEGIDLVDYSGGSGPVSINLDSGTAADGFGATDSISGIEQFVTGDSDDTVIAGAGDHDFDLGGGNNYYAWAPGDGNDTVRLGDGARYARSAGMGQ
jgi:Ca2+-binding RTX toxin-like protein